MIQNKQPRACVSNSRRRVARPQLRNVVIAYTYKNHTPPPNYYTYLRFDGRRNRRRVVVYAHRVALRARDGQQRLRRVHITGHSRRFQKDKEHGGRALQKRENNKKNTQEDSSDGEEDERRSDARYYRAMKGTASRFVVIQSTRAVAPATHHFNVQPQLSHYC